MIPRAIHLCGRAIDGRGHICAFFASRDEEYKALIPYFAEGIASGENVLNVVDAERLDDHREGVSVLLDGWTLEGQIRENPSFIPPDVYLRELLAARPNSALLG